MKYLKTFESMKDVFLGKEIGHEDRLIFVCTKDEKYLIWGYTIRNLSYNLERKKIPLVSVDKIIKGVKDKDGDGYDNILQYSGWRDDNAAQEFIDLVNKGGIQGVDYYSYETHEGVVAGDVLYEDLKDQLKIIHYKVGAIRDRGII